MWATALTMCALVALLAALGYTALAARRLEATLGALTQKQNEERVRLAREVEGVRATAVPGY